MSPISQPDIVVSCKSTPLIPLPLFQLPVMPFIVQLEILLSLTDQKSIALLPMFVNVHLWIVIIL